MRVLIDGYNVMFAGGLLGQRLGPDGLRKIRHRFLNDLSDALGPLDSLETTVVFDASRPMNGLPKATTHKGLSVIYAVGDENADARIEDLILKHSHPKDLTVVSTDRRVRQATTRRKARPLTAEAFWVELDARKRRRHSPDGAKPTSPPPPAGLKLSAEESEFWQGEFAEVDEMPETREAFSPESAMLTDEEVARIEWEVEQEFP